MSSTRGRGGRGRAQIGPSNPSNPTGSATPHRGRGGRGTRGGGRGGRGRGQGNAHSTSATPSLIAENPIRIFFADHNFPYDSSQETMEQFWAMCDHFGWERDDEDRTQALAEIRNAIAIQFNAFFGGDENNLESWQRLLHVVQEKNIPDNVKECKEVINSVHVNICDLVDYSLNGKPPRKHTTEDELAQYSRAFGKIYPKDNAYAEGLLRYLLRQIFGAYHGQRRRGRGRGRGSRRGASS